MSGYREISLRKLQLMENKMLEEFADFCDKNDLNYSLIGGTLLGAVRHKGFIPWDDDIDVGMPRPDFDRFLKLTKTDKISSSLIVMSGETEKNCSVPYAKIINVNTKIVRENTTHEDDGDGLWIDVMPIDGAGNSIEEAKKIMKKATHLQKACGRASSIPWKRREGESGLRGFMLCSFRLMYHLIGYNYFKKRLVKLGRKRDFNTSKYAAIVVSGFYGYGEIIEKNKIEPYVDHPFENRYYQIFGCWKEYLEGIYGNYMELPPENKRKSPHSFTVLIKAEKDEYDRE